MNRAGGGEAMTGERILKRYFIAMAIFAVAIGWYLWSASVNSVPEAYRGTAADPAAFLSVDQIQKSSQYSAIGSWLFFISYPWEWGMYLVLLFGGYSRRIGEKLEARIRHRLLQLAVYVLWISSVTFFVFLPLRIVGYSLARHYGISTQTIPSWIRDKLIAFGINAVLMLLVAAVALWFINRGGRWWLRLWPLSVPFLIFMMYIQPVVIDPLYNDFSELSNKGLERSILSMAVEAGIPADRVYEANMSAKTNALNAYVNGIGGSLRIVLWDTTLQRLNENEILYIMAHEMGHYVMHHLEYSALGAIGSSLLMLWIGSRLMRMMLLRRGGEWGIRQPGQYTVLPVLLLIISLLTFISLPLSNLVSRQAEASADRYAFRLTQDAQGAVSMYQKLAAASLSNVNPPTIVRWFRSTHPSIMERIVKVETAAIEHRVP
jgi:STE24 endopeptidase